MGNFQPPQSRRSHQLEDQEESIEAQEIYNSIYTYISFHKISRTSSIQDAILQNFWSYLIGTPMIIDPLH